MCIGYVSYHTMQTRSQTRKQASVVVAPAESSTNNVTFTLELQEDRRITRSMTRSIPVKQTILDVEFTEYDSSSDYDPDEEVVSEEFDFDEASAAWRENKMDMGNGTYKYKKNAFPSATRHAKIHPETGATTSMVLRSRR